MLTNGRIFTVEDVEIHAAGRFVRRAGQDLYVRQQSFATLIYLIEHRDRLVPKEELYRTVWKDVAVGDDAIAQCIADIRRVLRDDSRAPRFIKTVPKLGYRFVAPVIELAEGAAPASRVEAAAAASVAETAPQADVPTPAPSAALPRRSAWWWILGTAAVVVIAALWSSYGRRQAPIDTGASGTSRVLVAYFENQSGDRDLAWLGRGLPEMITTELSRFDRLSVLGRDQVDELLERAGITPGRAMTSAEISDLAARGHADVVIAGAFGAAGNAVRVDVRAVDAHTGRALGADSVVASRREDILSQVNVLSLKMAARLGLRPPPRTSAAVADVATPSLEAYRLYTLGIERSNAYQPDQAIGLLQRAVALDSDFAMGYARIGYARLFSIGDAEGARPYLEKAFQLSARLNEHDRSSIAAWYAVSHRDYDDGIRRFRALVARYPDDIEAIWRLGYILVGEHRLEEAVQVLQTGLAFDPESKELTNTLSSAYLRLGRLSEAIEMAVRYVALAPSEPNSHDTLGLAYQWAGRYEESQTEYARALALNPQFEVARVHRGNLYYQLGRFQDALAEYAQYRPPHAQLRDARALVCMAWTYAAMGRGADAMREARAAALQMSEFSSDLVLLALASGDLAQADAWAKRPVWSGTERGARPTRRADEVAFGAIALRRGQTDLAIAHMKRALSHAPPVWMQSGYEDALADVYRQLGRLDDAAAEYERVLGLNPRLPMTLYHYADVLERQQKRADARAMLARFLAVWNHADRNAPARRDAERRLAALDSR